MIGNNIWDGDLERRNQNIFNWGIEEVLIYNIL